MKWSTVFKSTVTGLFLSSTLLHPMNVLSATERSQPEHGSVPAITKQSLSDLAKNSGIYERTEQYGIGSHKVRIAILDNGFRGYKDAIGTTLNKDTAYHAGPVTVDPLTEEFHGTKMAEVVTYLLNEVGVDFSLSLYSAFGFTNLRTAIDQVIKEKYDLVLYSQVWEYGGNQDGTGFINTEVKRALNAGINWINAAGNFSQRIYRSKIDHAQLESDNQSHLVKFPGSHSSVQVRCEAPKNSKCRFRAVLSWGTFQDSIQIGTEQDLDFFLTDTQLKTIKASTLKQVLKISQNGESLYPREMIDTELDPGLYYLRAKFQSDNFPENEELQIAVSGEHLVLINPTEGETLLSPAILPGIITVGANDSKLSGFSRSLHKPEFRTPSLLEAESTNGGKNSFLGSSVASAVAVALSAVDLSLYPKLNTKDLIQKLKTGGTWEKAPAHSAENDSSSSVDPKNYPIRSHNGQSCLMTTRLGVFTPDIHRLLQGGKAWSVLTDTGIKLIINQDPLEKLGQPPLKAEQILVIGYDQYGQAERLIKPVSFRRKLLDITSGPSATYVEVVQLGSGIKICN